MYAWCQDMPHVTEDDYAKVLAELGGLRSIPGLVAHVAGPAGTGFRIVDVWETQEDAERFVREHLDPAVYRVHGDEVPAMREGFQTYEVSDRHS
jgi:hypothetical protein